MNASTREPGDLWAKKERDQNLSLAPSSSRRWSAFRNPRIVRVSRAFGGKDRHSKVCTVRGLRDRRIRLSIPTALQLYDLQDKLGVGQPSKVIDWLIDATKHEIDKLPPLQMPPGFTGFPNLASPNLFGSSLTTSLDMGSPASALLKQFSVTKKQNICDIGNTDHQNSQREDLTLSSSNYWDVGDLMRAKGKEVGDNIIREHELEKAKFAEPIIPARVNFLAMPNLSSHYQLGTQQHAGFTFQTDHHRNQFVANIVSDQISSSYSSQSMPTMPNLPLYNNVAPHPTVAESGFRLFGSGQSSMPSLHLFGSSTNLRTNMSDQYLKFLHPESIKNEDPTAAGVYKF